MDRATAELATALGPAYELRAADVLHLATAVGAARDRFITVNNKADFPKLNSEIGVTYPEDLHALHQSRALTIAPEARSNVQRSTGHCNQANNCAIDNSMPRSTSEPSTVTGARALARALELGQLSVGRSLRERAIARDRSGSGAPISCASAMKSRCPGSRLSALVIRRRADSSSPRRRASCAWK